jgi:hypothetical protein
MSSSQDIVYKFTSGFDDNKWMQEMVKKFYFPGVFDDKNTLANIKLISI